MFEREGYGMRLGLAFVFVGGMSVGAVVMALLFRGQAREADHDAVAWHFRVYLDGVNRALASKSPCDIRFQKEQGFGLPRDHEKEEYLFNFWVLNFDPYKTRHRDRFNSLATEMDLFKKAFDDGAQACTDDRLRVYLGH